MSLGKWVVCCLVLGVGIFVLLWITRPHEPAIESIQSGIQAKEQVRSMVHRLNAQSDPTQVFDAFEPSASSNTQKRSIK